MVAWLTMDLRVWQSGARVADTVFLSKLKASNHAAVVALGKSRAQGQTARVTLVAARAVDFAAELEPSEDFAHAVKQQMLQAAAWLDLQPLSLFKSLRQNGHKTDVLVDSWIEGNQFEVDLPPELIAACARLGLGISLLTND